MTSLHWNSFIVVELNVLIHNYSLTRLQKKNLPCLSITNISKLPSLLLSYFGNSFSWLLLLKKVFSLLNMTCLFMQGITSSGHLKVEPQNRNIDRTFCYKHTVNRMNSDHFTQFWYLGILLGKLRRKGDELWVTINKRGKTIKYRYLHV